MVAYGTGSNPIEIDDPRSKVNVTMIENVSQNDKKNKKHSENADTSTSVTFDIM